MPALNLGGGGGGLNSSRSSRGTVFDSIKQLKQVLNESIDSVLLDNMNIKSLKKSTKLINGRFLSEASGNINRSNIQQVAKTGVNRISLGAITHSSPTFDFSLEVENNH